MTVPLADFGFVSVMLVACVATALAFLTVLMAGSLSGVVMVGVFSLFLRRRTQESVVLGFFREAQNLTSSTAYTGQSDSETRRVLDRLVGLEFATLCSLPYRQLCGQIIAAINSEGASAAANGDAETPLTDLLAGKIHGPESHRAERLADFDRAARRIDHLQARLGGAVDRKVFILSVSFWLAAYVLLLWVPALSLVQWSPGFWGIITTWQSYAIYSSLAMILGLILSFASAMVCWMVFGWLDRALILR